MNKYVIGLWILTLFNNFHFEDRGFERARKDFKIRKISKIEFDESSGLIPASNGFWTVGDSGGQPTVYNFNLEGNLVDTIRYPISNIDWEDLAHDSYGNWYLGDLGNNRNQRRDLRIYKVNGSSVDTLNIKWADQTGFPPPENELNFDCEAFFWSEGSLYFFSKNRGEGKVKVYRTSDEPGVHTAQVIDEISIQRQVTGADINPSRSEFVLLCYGVIYTFEFSQDSPFSTPKWALKFGKGGQSEGIMYSSDSTLLITNEVGRVFEVSPR